MSIIRAVLGVLILFFDGLTSPKGVKRDRVKQALVNEKTARLALYQYKACPFCVKVRRAMKRQSLSIETRDAKRCSKSREELLQGGGVLKVPCLRIEDQGNVRWMYESDDILSYLQQQFS